MRRCLNPAILVLLIHLTGCSSTNDVVGGSPFQKRKYRPGWYLDFARKQKDVPQTTVTATRTTDPEPLDARLPLTDLTTTATQPLNASTSIVLADLASKEGAPNVHHEVLSKERVLDHGKDIAAPSRIDEPPEGPRYWNRMAIVSGIFLGLSIAVIAISGGGSILAYLLTFTFLTGLIGLLLTIKHKEKGKGIAIAAIAFPVVIIALVIASLNSVW